MTPKVQTLVILQSVLTSLTIQSEPFQDTLEQLERLNSNMRHKYRSMGMIDDFSNIVTNMISSLQEVQVSDIPCNSSVVINTYYVEQGRKHGKQD